MWKTFRNIVEISIASRRIFDSAITVPIPYLHAVDGARGGVAHVLVPEALDHLEHVRQDVVADAAAESVGERLAAGVRVAAAPLAAVAYRHAGRRRAVHHHVVVRAQLPGRPPATNEGSSYRAVSERSVPAATPRAQ